MVDAQPHEEQPERTPSEAIAAMKALPWWRRWVWWSTHETVENDIPSVLAIVETIAAVTFYWWLAARYGHYYFLLTSALVAPLVLLRSDESVALGLKWLQQWEARGDAKIRSGSACEIAAFAVSAVVLSPLLYLMLMSAIEMELGGKFYAAAILIAALGALLPAAASLLATAKCRRCNLFLVFSLSLPFPLILLYARLNDIAGHWGDLTALVGGLLYVFAALSASIFLVCSLIRLGAVALSLRAGFRQLPRNFASLVICRSFNETPELVPGISEIETEFSFSSSAQFDNHRLTSAIWLIFLFLPTWLYRFTLKSTAWFWWPLILIGTRPSVLIGGRLKRAEQPEHLHEDIARSLQGLIRIALALVVIGIFVWVNVYPLFQEGAPPSNPFLSVMGYMFVIDWAVVPWQLFGLGGAVLSLAILYWSDGAIRNWRRANSAGNERAMGWARARFGAIEALMRAQKLLFIGYWLVIGGHAALYLNSLKCYVATPAEVQRAAEWFYGGRAPAKCETGNGLPWSFRRSA